MLLASFVVQLFTLQSAVDPGNHRQGDFPEEPGHTSVLGFGLMAVTVLEGMLGPAYVPATQPPNRRTAGCRVIDHLLRLPLVTLIAGRLVIWDKVAELEKIRNFLTGQALTTILDAAYSVIYIVVMAFYSWILTIVALIVVPIQVGITLLGAPLFRRQFRQAAEEMPTHRHLVEVLTGIQTVKAQNVEVSRWKWQERYSLHLSHLKKP